MHYHLEHHHQNSNLPFPLNLYLKNFHQANHLNLNYLNPSLYQHKDFHHCLTLANQ
ncbi:hypothetical protein K690_0422 [Campylobacter jejuni HB-CJGB-QYT]|nr:hypothetical protein K690_0422 [Campylobacter jejuni HB-CJGB-QYT]